MEYTLAIIKPDAVKAGKAAEIQQLAEIAGFQITAKQQLQVLRWTYPLQLDTFMCRTGCAEVLLAPPCVPLLLCRS